MARVKTKWVEKGWGIQLGVNHEERLTNLRFADDVLLVARSLKVLKCMMGGMRRAVAEVGLEMHFGKTKILANAKGRKQSQAKYIEIGGAQIKIMSPAKSTKYLGRAVAFTDFYNCEIKHRSSCGCESLLNTKESCAIAGSL